MTRTEERLRDALRASASRIRDEELRSLVAPEVPGLRDVPEPDRLRAARRRGWVVPLAVAASVALIVGAAVGVGNYLRHHGASAPPAIPSGGLPKYYATIEGTGPVLPRVTIRATRTGAVVATVADPLGPGQTPEPAPSNTVTPVNTPNPYSGQMEAVDLATADDVTFYVLYQIRPQHTNSPSGTIIESFQIDSAGRPGLLSQVKGGVLAGQEGSNETIAVAPGGGEIAVTLPATSSLTDQHQEILVIDTRTGAHRVWRGGLDRTGAMVTINSLSWSRDGRGLAYVAQWCYPSDGGWVNLPTGPICTPGNVRPTRSVRQVREIDTTAAGGLLSSSRILLAQSSRYPNLTQALLSPDGTSLTAIVLSGPETPGDGRYSVPGPHDLSIVTISVSSGAETAVLYRTHGGTAFWSTLTADASGRFLVLGNSFYGGPMGWIDAGRLRELKGQAGTPVAW
jgi:hypothetical protein